MRYGLIGALALSCTVAACGLPTSAPGNEASAADGGALENAADFGNDAAGPSQSATPTPAPYETAGNTTAAIDAKTLPAAFQGRWGLGEADCDPKMDYAAKGLMTVTADKLSFYESRATIARLETVSPTELKASLSFSGEGQTWTEDTPLVLSDGGKALTRTSHEGQTLRYTRCKA